jgi:hypothetical protein
MSQPVNTYRDNQLKPDGQSGVDYYRGLQSSSETQPEAKYSLQYDVLANQDIAFDLLHVSFLADREIQAEKTKAAVKSLSADFSDNRPGLEHRGLFLNTKNTDKARFLFTLNDTNSSIPKIINSITDNKIDLSRDVSGLFLNSDSENSYTIPQLYKSKFNTSITFDIISETKYGRTIFKVQNGGINYEVEWISDVSGTASLATYINTFNSPYLCEPLNNFYHLYKSYNWNFIKNYTEMKIVLENTISSASTNGWAIVLIQRGVVYIHKVVSGVNYILGFMNQYEKTAPISNGLTDTIHVYWLDEPRSMVDGGGQDHNFNHELHAQIPLVDITVNNTVYTFKNRILGNGGYADILDISKTRITPQLDTDDISSNDFYSLATRYDPKRADGTPIEQEYLDQMRTSGYLSSLYDKLYYNHNWTRQQIGDLSSVFVPIDDPDDLTDATFSEITPNIPYKREDFTFDFPYLYYRINTSSTESTELTNMIKAKYNPIKWKNNDYSFNDLNNAQFIQNIYGSSGPSYTEDLSFGIYDFVFDLKKCYLPYVDGNHLKLDSTHTSSRFCSITELGQDICENEVFVRGYFYGNFHEKGHDYFVFKYKEPADYPYLSDVSNSLDYRLFTPATGGQPAVYNSRLPKGGDKYRNFLGLKTDYNTTGYITIHPEITGMNYIPIRVNFQRTVKVKRNKDNSTIEDLSFSPISNGTGVFLLKVNCLENKAIYDAAPYNSSYTDNATSTVQIGGYNTTTIGSDVTGSLQSTWNYYNRTKLKPVKFIIDYSNNGTEYNPGLIQEIGEVTNKNISMYLPLSGKRDEGSWSRGQISWGDKNTTEYDKYIKNGDICQNYLATQELTDISFILPPISCAHGSKIHNNIYDYKQHVLPFTTDTTFTNLIDPDKYDSSSSIFNPSTDAYNGNFYLNGKYTTIITPNSIGGTQKYAIPIRVVRKNTANPTQDTSEFLITTQLTSQQLFFTGNYRVKVLDLQNISVNDFPFNFPFEVNKTHPNYTNQTVADVSFVISELPLNGNILVSDVNTIIPPTNRMFDQNYRFKPYGILQDVSNQQFDETIMRVETATYDISYNNQLYRTPNRNIITFEVNNNYTAPKIYQNTIGNGLVLEANIFNKTSITDLSFQFDLTNYFLVDEEFTNIELDIAKIDYVQGYNQFTNNSNDYSFELVGAEGIKVKLYKYDTVNHTRILELNTFSNNIETQIPLNSQRQPRIKLAIRSNNPPPPNTSDGTITLNQTITFNIFNKDDQIYYSEYAFNAGHIGQTVYVVDGEVRFPINSIDVYIPTWVDNEIVNMAYLNAVTTVTSVTNSRQIDRSDGKVSIVTLANGWTLNNPIKSDTKREFVTEYEICECVPKTIHKEIGPNGTQTMAEWISNRAKNLYFHPKQTTTFSIDLGKRSSQRDTNYRQFNNFR